MTSKFPAAATALIAVALLALAAAPLVVSAETLDPPTAEVRPHEMTLHGDTRVDPYYWLRERENPEVIAYLEAENAYADHILAPTDELQDELFEEMVARIDPTDESVPYELDGYWYYTRYREGADYPIYCRKQGSLDADEEIMVDGNELAEGQSYFSLAGLTVSSDNQMIAFGVDTVGRRKYDIHFKDLTTGEILDHTIEQARPNLEWAEGSRTLFYARQDPETLRTYQIWRHELGSSADDLLVFQEDDETFSCGIGKSKSREYLMIRSSQTLSDEVHVLRADDPTGEWKVFEPRQREFEYSVDHADGRFLIRTNWNAENFRLMEVDGSDTGRENWRTVIAHRDDVLLEQFEVYTGFLVVRERKGGLPHLRVIPAEGEEYELEFPDPTYSAFINGTPEVDTTTLRYSYSSMTTPWTVYDFDMNTRAQQLMKRDRVLGDFDPSNYESQYLWAEARDGTEVPISIVYRKDMLDRGKNPLMEYGYGSYGSSSWASFSSTRLSLLDRGFVWATAHVRGGQELGRRWYEDGKMFNKKNTFTDFIDCGRYLARNDWCDADRIYAYGGSAGGLLVGAVMNMAPELYDGIIASVPFVDVVTTMLDESIPLTTFEWDEWGDPKNEDSYEYMLSYSPYDQVEAKAYPNLMVTTGLHDSQVQYWEPAKWVAKLRAMKTDDNMLVMITNMDAGHGGASGRLRAQRETAQKYAFVLHLANRHDAAASRGGASEPGER